MTSLSSPDLEDVVSLELLYDQETHCEKHWQLQGLGAPQHLDKIPRCDRSAAYLETRTCTETVTQLVCAEHYAEIISSRHQWGCLACGEVHDPLDGHWDWRAL